MARKKIEIPLTEFAKEIVHLLEMGFTKGQVGELFRVGIARTDYPVQRHLAGKDVKIASQIEKYSDEFSGFVSQSLENDPNYNDLNINQVAQDHVVPVSVLLTHWEENKDKLNDEEWIKKTLGDALHVCIITKDEDNRLNQMGLRSSMPKGWKWTDGTDGTHFFDRYNAAGIVIPGKTK